MNALQGRLHEASSLGLHLRCETRDGSSVEEGISESSAGSGVGPPFA